MDQPRLYSITAAPVYFPFTIHRNPIILVNAFNSPGHSSSPPLSSPLPCAIDALLIIGMTKAISDRLSDAPRGGGKGGRGGEGVRESAVRFVPFRPRAIFLMERIFLM